MITKEFIEFKNYGKCIKISNGIIDAVAVLLETGDVDETGFMEEDSVVISSPAIVTAKDIRAVQLAKSAICAGINTVMKEFSIQAEEITILYKE